MDTLEFRDKMYNYLHSGIQHKWQWQNGVVITKVSVARGETKLLPTHLMPREVQAREQRPGIVVR